MRVFLIGYMGAGKSTLGKRLAQSLGYDFCDLDRYIEEKTKCSIHSFFAKYGELVFRKEEQKCLDELFIRENIVISVGGGTPCFKDNMERMNSYGTTIFLNPPLTLLAQRLKRNIKNRPLLAGKDEQELVDFITQHYQERKAYYQKAKYQIQATNIKVEDLLPFFDKKY